MTLTVGTCKHSDECFPKEVELAQRVPEDFKPPNRADVQLKWPSQEAISNEGLNVLPHSRESAAALMPHTSTPVSPSLAYSHLRSSLELESWLRWKPPDNKEDTKGHAYHAVNDRLQLSARRHLPQHRATYVLPVTKSSLAYFAQAIPSRRLSFPPDRRVCILPAWASAHRSLSIEFAWRAHYKPPNIGGEGQQPSAIVISARKNTSVSCSPLHKVALMLAVLPLASSARVINMRRPHNELDWRAYNPPDATGHRQSVEAVNKAGKGIIRGHIPATRPTFAPITRLPLLWPTRASLACCHTVRRSCPLAVVISMRYPSYRAPMERVAFELPYEDLHIMCTMKIYITSLLIEIHSSYIFKTCR